MSLVLPQQSNRVSARGLLREEGGEVKTQKAILEWGHESQTERQNRQERNKESQGRQEKQEQVLTFFKQCTC